MITERDLEGIMLNAYACNARCVEIQPTFVTFDFIFESDYQCFAAWMAIAHPTVALSAEAEACDA
jgi:hypothetical protein